MSDKKTPHPRAKGDEDTTPTHTTLGQALAAFQADAPKIDLDGEVNAGRAGKFRYATLGNIIDKVRPVLFKHGLAFSQTVEGDRLITRLILASDADNKALESSFPLPFGDDPKRNGALLTYYRRYSLTAILGIVGEDDTDAPAVEGKANVKPVMSDDELKRALDAIASGDKNVLESCHAQRRMEPNQYREIVQAEWAKLPPE